MPGGPRPRLVSLLGLLARRARAQLVLAVAMFATIVCAATSLATLLAYAEEVPSQGFTRLLTAEPARALVHVDAALGRDGPDRRDEIVRTAVAQRLGPDIGAAAEGPHVDMAGQSAPYRLPPQLGRPGALTSFWFFDDLSQQATIVSGRWPRLGATDPAGVVEVAVSAAAARVLPAAPGDRFTLTSATFAAPVDVVVTGVYQARDPANAVARLDPTAGAGIVEGEFTSLGPLVVPREEFVQRFAASARLSWLVRPDLTGLDPAAVVRLRDDLAALRTQVSSDPEFGGAVSVTTGLDVLLDQALRSVVVSRSTLPVPCVLLVILAGCALVYMGVLVHGRRSRERELMRARGASAAQTGAAAAIEGSALAVPAVLLGPPLASVLLRWGSSPLRSGESGAVPAIASMSIWLAMAAVAVVSVLALALPELVVSHRGGWRERIRPGVARSGGDVALLLVAVAAYLQLRAAGSPFVSADLRRVRADPVFVIAPVLLLVAVALLGLRLLPVPARWAAHRVAANRGAVPALGIWPVSRRAARYAAPVLLLVLAVSAGLLATVATASGARSRADQADHQVGADVRVTGPAGFDTGSSSAGPSEPAQLLAVPGAHSAMAVARDQVDTGSGPAVQLLALDASRAGDVVLLRPDLLDRPAGDAFAALGAPTSEAAAPLPAGAGKVSGMVSITVEDADAPIALAPLVLTLVVRDQVGLVRLVPWGEVIADGSRQSLAAPLPADSSALLGVQVTYTIDPRSAVVPRHGSAAVTLTDLRVDEHLLDLSATGWSTAIGGDDRGWTPVATTGPGTLAFVVPINRPFARVSILAGTPEQLNRPVSLTAMASREFMRAHQRRVGEDVGVQVRGVPLTVRLGAVVAAVPSVAADEALVVDLAALQRALLREAGITISPEEWWLATTSGSERSVATAIRAQGPAVATAVLDRVSVRGMLDEDPLGLAFQGALRIALAGGLVFTLVGFVVHALVAVDERRAETALLRALGMPARHVSAALLVEQALVLALGLLLGIVAGLLVSRLVVPLTIVSPRTGTVVPPAVLVVPWVQICALAAGLFVSLLLAVAAGRRTLARDRAAVQVRAGDAR